MQANADITRKLDALFEAWNHSDAPGLIVGIAHKGQVIYRRGFGLASVEQHTLNTPKTRMRIGSTSKHMTSFAALLLAEAGKLDIDASVRTYLPELSGPAGDPTLRQLMHHSGGLHDPYDLPGILFCSGFPFMLFEGAGLELSQRFTSASFAPGERMIYNNNGYYLLSLVVERVGQQPFADFLKQRIFEPLAMRETQLLASDMQMIPNLASLHVPQADGSWRRGLYPSEELLGSGGIVSSLDDMLRWLAHLRAPTRLGSAQTWEQMLTRPRYSSGALGDYGLGLTREPYRGVEIIHHAGAVLGGTCQMLTVPEHGLDIILMFNRMDGPAPATALKVIDVMLADNALEPAIEPARAEPYQNLIGRWYSQRSHRLLGIVKHEVAAAAEGTVPVLALSIHEQVMGLLKPSDAGLRMSSPSHGTIEVRLPSQAEGKPERIEFTDSGHVEVFARLPDQGPATSELAADLVGRYHYADFNREVSVRIEDGTLMLDLHPAYGKSRLRLQPLSHDVCSYTLTGSWPIAVPTAGSLSIERTDGVITGLWLNGARTRNLWLQRC